MAHRHPTLYMILGLVFLGITLAFIFIDVALDWPSSTHAALFILSLFSLVLALVYFYPGVQEERGF